MSNDFFFAETQKALAIQIIINTTSMYAFNHVIITSKINTKIKIYKGLFSDK